MLINSKGNMDMPALQRGKFNIGSMSHSPDSVADSKQF